MMLNHRTYLLTAVLFAAITVLQGCAPVRRAETTPQQRAIFPEKRIGVIIFWPEKKVAFTERLFKVVFATQEENFYSLDGFVNIPEIIAPYAMAPLTQAAHWNQELLWPQQSSIISPEIIERIEAEFNRSRVKMKGNFADSTTAFSNEFFARRSQAFLQTPPDQGLLNCAQEHGFDYLLEIYLAGVSILETPPMDPFVDQYAYSRMISVDDGKVIWFGKGSGSTRIEEDFDSFKDLETNNFELMKRLVIRTAEQMFPVNEEINPLHLYYGLYYVRPE